MNMERRILSIDFDYFQDVSRDTLLECYPDGYDLPPSYLSLHGQVITTIQKQQKNLRK